jgi:uncharacterized protein YndB with AHSA1/START domain
MTTVTEPGRLRPDADRAAVRFERLYDATPDELWSALTDPEQIRGWLADASRFQLEPDGEVMIDFGGDDETGGRVDGRIRELDPPRLLEYTWTFPGEPESVVRFEIVPREHGVLLVLDHRLLSRESLVGYGAGWHAHLDVLALHLRGERGSWDGRYRELRPEYERQASAL